MVKLKIGSAEHRDLMCREFTRSFKAFEVSDIRWPELEPDDLARLRAMPFWGEALETEWTASSRIRLMVEAEGDSMVRDAIAMQGYEEARHAELMTSMMQHYGIALPDPEGYKPRDPEWGFMRMGYGEVFDTFFAFGLFKLAADTSFFPPSLVEIFERVIAEEGRHIIFFSNWAAHGGANASMVAKPWFSIRRAAALSVQAFNRARTALQVARGGEEFGKSDDLVIQAKDQLCGDDITLRKFVETCLSENERRMAGFDPRLPRPTLLPRTMGLLLKAMPRPAASPNHSV